MAGDDKPEIVERIDEILEEEKRTFAEKVVLKIKKGYW